MPASESLLNVYDELCKYFGLRSQDSYLNAADGKTGQSASNQKSSSSDKKVFDALFSDGQYNEGIDEIVEKMNSVKKQNSTSPSPASVENFCVTPYTSQKNDEYAGRGNVPVHNPKVTNKREQGYGFKLKDTGKKDKAKKPIFVPVKLPVGSWKKDSKQEIVDEYKFNVQELNPEAFSSSANPVSVVQVFPVDRLPEVSDTEVLTLFMSTIDSVNMSMAVPYVDVTVSVETETGTSEIPSFSFSGFLNDGRPDNTAISSAPFVDQSVSGGGTKTREYGAVTKSETVASMEIFTSPQTLVNSENVKYNENLSVAGQPIDVFRPYMSLESLSLSVVGTGKGLISYKTADMKLKLFDRGRLSSIAPIVSPSKFSLVKFDIEYGWSHRSGKKVSRPSDANFEDRIGQMIDSMRVTESYSVSNSNFTFENDGSVSIDLKLSMLGNRAFKNSTVKFQPDTIGAEELIKQFEDIKKVLSTFPGNINVPDVLNGDVDTILQMSKEDITAINSLVKTVSKFSGGNKQAVETLTKFLYGPPNPKAKQDLNNGSVATFQTSRKKAVAEMVRRLTETPDPWIRYQGLASKPGVIADEILGTQVTSGPDKGLFSDNYVSLGKVIVDTLGPLLQKQGEVIFIFGCFNQDAGAMYDHNIAQFPIKVRHTKKSEKEPDEVTLQTALERSLTKITKLTPEIYMQLLNEEFVQRESSDAYGLNLIYSPATYGPEGDVKVAYQAALKRDFKEADPSRKDDDDLSSAGQLILERRKTENLKAIYGAGKRARATFVQPRLNIRIDTKPASSSQKNDPSKPVSLVTRVIITDQAASSIGDSGRMFDKIMSQGFFIKDDFSSSTQGSESAARSCRHGETSARLVQDLLNKGILEPPKNTVADISGFIKRSSEIPGIDTARLESDIGKIYFVNTKKVNNNSELRKFLYDYFPTLIYGSMGSGILMASLSSNQNDALNTIALQRQGNNYPKTVGMPLMIHPTQLSMEVIGSPLFKYSQKFFIDFGTNTTADNFYVVTGIDMNFGTGEYKTSLKMTQLESFGKFAKVSDSILDVLLGMYQVEVSPPPPPPPPRPRPKPKQKPKTPPTPAPPNSK